MRRVLVLCLSSLVATAQASVERAQALLAAGKAAEAVAVLEPLVAARPQDANLQRSLAVALQNADREEDAVAPAERAVELAPRDANNHIVLGGVLGALAGQPGVGLFRQMRLAPRIRSAFETAVELDPQHLGAQQALFSFYLVAPAIAGGGHDKAARQAATIARLDAPAGQRAQLQLAIAGKDWASAERQLAAVPVDDADGLRLRGVLAIAYQGEERWVDAFRILEAVVGARPDALGAWYQIGRTAVLSGQRLEQGEAAFKRYLAGTPDADDPPLAAAHWRLGMLYERMARKAEARAQYQQALARDPQHAEAKAALKKLG
jgi:tetratricopeptide (TPR) repeat protein